MKFNYRIALLVAFIAQFGLMAMEPKQGQESVETSAWKRPDFWQESWPKPTAQNTALAFDLDDTIIEKKSMPGLYLNIAIRGMVNAPLSLLKMWTKTPRDQNGVKIEGATPQMIWDGIAINNPRLQNFIPTILEKTASSHQLKPGTPLLFTDLKKKGYETIYATNKDRASYDDAAQVLNVENTLASAPSYTFSDAADKVLVTMPNAQVLTKFNNYTNHTPAFKTIIDKITHAKETDKIKHIEVSKPNLDYYKKLKEMAPDKNIIFFDDKEDNVKAAKEAGLVGIKVKGPQDIAKALYQLGILDQSQVDNIAAQDRRSYSMYLLGAALVGGGAYLGYQKYKQNAE